jgi:hypothetical protein
VLQVLPDRVVRMAELLLWLLNGAATASEARVSRWTSILKMEWMVAGNVVVW